MLTKTQADKIIDEVLEEFGYEIEFVDDEQAWETFDSHAQFLLKMSGQEFLDRWDAGEWKDDPDQPGVVAMIMLMPLVGRKYPTGEPE